MWSVLNFKKSKTFSFITTVVLTVLIYHIFIRQDHPLPQAIYHTVDEEYVPNTMVPYSKNYHRSCKGLFVKGTLIPPCSRKSNLKDCARNIAEEWKPDGCKLKYYSKESLITCLKKFSKTGRKTIYFFGDSRVNTVYECMKKRLPGTPVYQKFKNSTYIKEADVYINLLRTIYVSDDFRNNLTKILREEEKPILVYLSNTLWYVQKNLKVKNPFEPFMEYEKDLTELLPLLNRMSAITKTVWPLQATVHKDVQKPPLRIQDRVQWVDLYNDATNKILKPSNVTLSYSIRSLGKATINLYKDDTHLGVKADAIVVEMLFNYICNNQWQQTDVQDNDEEICCSKQDKWT